MINPAVDGDEPDPNCRPTVDHLATPNKFGEQSGGTFTTGTYLTPKILAHEICTWRASTTAMPTSTA